MIVSAVTEFNRFYAPEPTRPPVTLLPSSSSSFTAYPQQPQQSQQPLAEASGGGAESSSHQPSHDPAMYRLPLPGSEPMKTDVEQFPAVPMEQEDAGLAARSQGWLSECLIFCLINYSPLVVAQKVYSNNNNNKIK